VEKYLWEITYAMTYHSDTFEIITKEMDSTMAAETAKKHFQFMNSSYDESSIIGITFKGTVYE